MKVCTALTSAICVLLFCANVLHAADRETASAYLEGAESLIKDGSYKDAIGMCERALQQDSAYPDAHFKIAVCQEKLNQPKEAFKSYEKAQALADKEKNITLSRKCKAAAEKLCPGLLEIREADQKLIKKLMPLADEAFAAGFLDTAHDTYKMIVALDPNNAKALSGASKAKYAIDKRGDPIRAKIAEAGLAEVWYLLGAGKKEEARKNALNVASKYADTQPGKEAQQLLENNFQPPKGEDIALLEQQLSAKVKLRATRPAGKTSPSKTTTTKSIPGIVDIDALTDKYQKESGTIIKSKLAATFKEAFTKGKAFYAKAQPGTEGNQENLAKALEQFIRCDQLAAAMEKQNVQDPTVTKDHAEASMLRYGCMKMVTLAH